MSILALGRKQKKEEKEKIPNQRRGESKKKKKFPIKDREKTEENNHVNGDIRAGKVEK